MIKIKSMRDVQTLAGQAHRAVTGTRAQAVSELAYLEHEKERLERELNVWTCNQKKAESRLQALHQRIAMLQGVLEVQPSAERRAQRAKEEAPDTSQEPESSWRKISLEY